MEHSPDVSGGSNHLSPPRLAQPERVMKKLLAVLHRRPFYPRANADGSCRRLMKPALERLEDRLAPTARPPGVCRRPVPAAGLFKEFTPSGTLVRTVPIPPGSTRLRTPATSSPTPPATCWSTTAPTTPT